MSEEVNPKHVDILLVEDNEGDIRLTQEALGVGEFWVSVVTLPPRSKRG